MRQSPPAHLVADLAAGGISDVECLFPDVSGYPRGKLMPAKAFAGGAELRIAQAIPMQCVTGDYSFDPVFPDQVKQEHWWARRGTAALLAGEYVKYQAALFRPAVEWLHSSGHGATEPPRAEMRR